MNESAMLTGVPQLQEEQRCARFLVAAMIAVLILGTAQWVEAQSFGSDREIYLGAGVTSTSSDDGADLGDGFHIVGGFGMRRSRHVVFAIELDYTSRARDFEGGVVRLQGEDLALDAHVVLLALVDKRVQPYATLGAGLSRSHTESLRRSGEAGAIDPTPPEVVTGSETAWGPHLRVGAGLLVFVADSFSLRAEWRFRFRFSDAFPGVWNELGVTLGYHF